MVTKFNHTLGDTRPLVFRAKLNGKPYSFTGASVTIKIWDAASGAVIIDNAPCTPDANQSAYAGVCRFDYALAEANPAFIAGMYKARFVSVNPSEIQTFPTAEFGQEYISITVNNGA